MHTKLQELDLGLASVPGRRGIDPNGIEVVFHGYGAEHDARVRELLEAARKQLHDQRPSDDH